MAVHDTGVSTLWYSNNYGAVLTTFALVRTLENMGRKVIVLDQSPMDGVPAYSKVDSLSRRFMVQHGIACTEPLDSDEKIHALNDTLDTFIVGSDQVWRWWYTQAQGSYPFLDFAKGSKRKIAVASSFGIAKESRPKPLVEKAKWYLKRFDAVSVREKSGLDILSQVYDVKGEWVLDPVFLCDIKVYDEVSQAESPEKEPYLLTYVLNPDKTIRELIASVAAEKGVKIINMVDGQADTAAAQQALNSGAVVHDLTAERWVNYIRHADFFVTDSFHGVCFSLLFRRPFVCVSAPGRGVTRFQSLLELTGLRHKLLPSGYTTEQREVAMSPIDWAEVQTRLCAMRDKNLKWLETALHQPRAEALQVLGDFTHDVLYPQSGLKDRKYLLLVKLEALCHSVERLFVPLCLRIRALWFSGLVYVTFNRKKRHELRSRAYEQTVMSALFKSGVRR